MSEQKSQNSKTSQKRLKQPYEILREVLMKVKFYHSMIDRQFELTVFARHWLNQLCFEYHFAQTIEKPHFWSRWYFAWIYRVHSADFPMPILPEELMPEHQIQAVPGSSLDSNGFLGYFKELKDSNGRFFLSFTGDPIEPLITNLKAVRQSMKMLIEQAAGNAERQQMLILHYKDIGLNIEVAEFIPKVRAYAVQHKFPGLKTGHIIAWVSGMNLYFEELQDEITEMGFAAYQSEGQEPLLKLILILRNKLKSALLNMVLDLFLPLLESSRVECKVGQGKLKCKRINPIRRSWLSAFIDRLLSLFRKKPEPQEPQVSSFEVKQQKPKVSIQRIKPQPKPAIEELGVFTDLHSALAKFIEELVEDLAPEKDEKGVVTDYKAMFDQFEVPEDERDLSYTRFILAGKIPGADPMDFRYKDQTIVNSTHWLYDRIKDLLNRFDFPESGSLTRDEAFRFLEEVRLLFYPSRRETSEKRKYGTFAQFRINLRRLFVSNKIHSRYNALMNKISGFLDKAREQYEKEGKK